ncbi:hypothetical protein F4820DRAFT_431244 [Hypoxylon rubiginosum]|uniref:Uncharacterized protein n=1 Tax=Hypoxylon rubiginosum TaxID=110542 RepID=A0ACB9YSJ0_9PEZI|nr:hypothetical protein F4820DRAFT_431244 [Hypoxylon rubiginosum]
MSCNSSRYPRRCLVILILDSPPGLLGSYVGHFQTKLQRNVLSRPLNFSPPAPPNKSTIINVATTPCLIRHQHR